MLKHLKHHLPHFLALVFSLQSGILELLAFTLILSSISFLLKILQTNQSTVSLSKKYRVKINVKISFLLRERDVELYQTNLLTTSSLFAKFIYRIIVVSVKIRSIFTEKPVTAKNRFGRHHSTEGLNMKSTLIHWHMFFDSQL